MMKKNLFAAFLSCSILFSALGTTAAAHTQPSNVSHSAAETHWDIFETGYMTPGGATIDKHSSGKGILVKTSSRLSNSDCFTNIGSCVSHAVNAWTSAKFNNSYLFSGKIREVASNYALTQSDINNEITLVEITAVNDTDDMEYWGRAMLEYATCYPSTSSGQHIKTCQIRLNEATLGSKTGSIKLDYQKYTITHELGHIIGLADLSSGDLQDSRYSSYLMGYNNWTMLYPTDADIKGAAVISGYHTTHSNYKYTFYNNSSHKKSCGLCDGYILENHDVSGGKCKICNHIVARTTDTWKVIDGPLNVRQIASTDASSYGVITNGTIFKIDQVQQDRNFLLARISSVSSLGSGSTCSAANAVGHWVAIEYCTVV